MPRGKSQVEASEEYANLDGHLAIGHEIKKSCRFGIFEDIGV
jgi:hypothetical protein